MKTKYLIVRIIAKTSHVASCFVFWSYNWFFGYCPFYFVRRFYLRNVLGIKVGKGSYIHIGCKVKAGLRIGRNSIIGRNCVLWGDIQIGDNVSIVAESYIFSSSHYVDDENFMAFHKQVEIGDRAWIGARSIVQPGVIIGEGAVLACGSVATKSLDPYGIYGGVPAKFLRYRNREICYELQFKAYFS